MTAWNVDHKRRPRGPTVAEQIENGLALAGMLVCFLLILCGVAIGLWEF
jgi:hypothetical protein